MNGPSRTRRRVVEVSRRPSVELSAIRIVIEEDLDPDVSYLDQKEFSDRRVAYRRKEFHFIGVRAEADVIIEGTTQTLTSEGLWGIESDSDDKYIDQICEEEWETLRGVLKTVGVSTARLPQNVDPDWIERRT